MSEPKNIQIGASSGRLAALLLCSLLPLALLILPPLVVLPEWSCRGIHVAGRTKQHSGLLCLTTRCCAALRALTGHKWQFAWRRRGQLGDDDLNWPLTDEDGVLTMYGN